MDAIEQANISKEVRDAISEAQCVPTRLGVGLFNTPKKTAAELPRRPVV